MVAPRDSVPPDDDPMGPPKTAVEVQCIHCGSIYMSDLIRWEPDVDFPDGGFWICPVDGCDGKGFCFDIFPTDPEVARQFGVEYIDCPEAEEDEEDFEDDFDLPDPPLDDPPSSNPPRGPRSSGFSDDDIPF